MRDGQKFNPLAWHRGVFSVECTLDAQEGIVLLALVSHADESGRAFPGLGVIASKTRVSRRKVILSLDELERRELFTRERQTRGQGFGANHYQLSAVPRRSALHALPSEVASSAPHAPPSAPRALPVVHPMHSGSAPGAPYLLRELPNRTTQGTIGAKTKEPKRSPTKGSQKASRRSPTKGSPKQATALPSDWKPSSSHIAYAAKHGLDLETLADGFRGHAEGKDRRAVSWDGAFRTWLANEAKWKRERGRNSKAQARVQSGPYETKPEAKNEDWLELTGGGE